MKTSKTDNIRYKIHEPLFRVGKNIARPFLKQNVRLLQKNRYISVILRYWSLSTKSTKIIVASLLGLVDQQGVQQFFKSPVCAFLLQLLGLFFFVEFKK